MKFKMIAIVVCASAMSCLLAQGTSSLLPADYDSGADAAIGGDTVEVMGRGVGTTKVEALKDAYRDAIERAVGLYVDAEQMAKNDELVSEQILTQSNAYIVKYTVTKETADTNGLITLKILATVKKSALAKRLSDVMPSQSFKLGDDAQNLHAQIVTQERRNEDAVALLKKTLDGVNPITQLVRLSLADTKMLSREVGDGSEKRTAYFYRFKFEVDEKKYYDEYLPPLLKVLDQISIEKPRTVRLQSGTRSSCGVDQRDMERIENYIAIGDDVYNQQRSLSRGMSPSLLLKGLSSGMSGRNSEGMYEGVVALGTAKDAWRLSRVGESPSYGYGVQFEVPDRWGRNSMEEEWKERWKEEERRMALKNRGPKRNGMGTEGFQVMVITELNGSRTSAKAKCYKLPRSCAEVVFYWQWRLCGGYLQSGDKLLGRTTYDFVLRDKDNEDVCVRTVAFANIALMNSMAGRGKMFDGEDRYNDGYGWYVTPMLHTDAKSMHRWIGFDIPRDDLPKVASVAIELAE